MDTNTALTTVEGTFVEEVSQADTDSTLVDAWLQGLPESTQAQYRREIKSLVDYTGKHLHEITIFDLQAYERDKLMGKAETTRARSIAAIKSFYKRIRQAGLITVNPAEFLRSPKIKETLTERYLTPEQVTDIIAQARNERDRVMLSLMYFAGMRVGEVVALTWVDILPTDTGATLTVYGKGSKTRYVAIDVEMHNDLLSLPHTSPFVFVSRKFGDSMTTTQAQRIVVDAAARAGIKASPHYMRHAHASHLLQEGVPVAEVRDELGHANISTTNKYAHSVGGKALGSVLRRK